MSRLPLAPATLLSIFMILCCLAFRDAIMLTQKEESSKFHWVSIPTSQAHNYFSVYDLAAMSFNQSLRYCDRKYLGMAPNDYGECCLGSISTGHTVMYSDFRCGDLKPKDYFRRYVPKSSADQPLHKHQNKILHNMVDVIRLMRTNRLVMAGDSLASQVISAAICDWKRHSIDPLVTNYSSFLTHEVNSHPADTPSIKNFVHDKDYVIPYGFWLFDVYVTNRTFEYTSRERKPQRFNSSIANMKTYRPDVNFTIIERFSQASDVLLLNYGIHYNVFAEYRNATDRLLTGLRGFATEKVLIWRETLPQHFNSSGGEYSTLDKSKNISTCKPVNFTANPDLYNKRNRIVVEVADSLGYHIHYINYNQDINVLNRDSEDTNVPVLFVIPIYDMFLELSSMHHERDCTHYCYSPYIWEHIFDRLYRAISIAKKFYKRLL